MIRLNEDDIIQINRIVCSIQKEEYNLLKPEELSSALSNYDSYYDTDEEIISSIFRALIINHCFSNGNKRTANIFLLMVKPPKCSDKILEDLTFRIASEGGSKIPVQEIARILY